MILDSIMKELFNEARGVKENMHTIMEEDPCMEESAMEHNSEGGGSPFGSFNELDIGMSDVPTQSIEHLIKDDDQLEKDMGITKQSILDMNTAETNSVLRLTSTNTINSNSISSISNLSSSIINIKPAILPFYSDPNLKDGSLYFNYLRADVAKSLLVKNSTTPEALLDRLAFMGRKISQLWIGNDITVEQFNHFSELLRDKNYLVSFPYMLETFRKLGQFQMHHNGFKKFCDLFRVCLSQSNNAKTVSIPLNLLTLASTYYTTKPDGRVVYVIQGIVSHSIFQNPKFWEVCILFNIFTMRNHSDKKRNNSPKQTNFITQIVANIIAVAFHMDEILKDKNIIKQVCCRFMNLYKLTENQACDLISYLQNMQLKSSMIHK